MSADTPANNNQMARSITDVGKKVFSYTKSFLQRLILRKRMGPLQVEIDTQNELRRSVTAIPLTAIGLGGTIGE